MKSIPNYPKDQPRFLFRALVIAVCVLVILEGCHGFRQRRYFRHKLSHIQHQSFAQRRVARQQLGISSKCSGECSQHGTCNEELGRCDCPRGRHGPSCEVANMTGVCRHYGFSKSSECFDTSPSMCLNSCNVRGNCMSGFCHCDEGFYGTDCSLSLDANGKPELLAGQGYQPRARPPKIYVYELPPNLTNVWFNTNRLDRPLFYLFWQRLLSSGVRVANGDEADFYFMPIKARIGALDDQVILESIEYIRTHWPWWDIHGGGEKHLIIQTGDMGRREHPEDVRKASSKVIWLTHWGLHKDNKYAYWDASHRPGKDIVIPVYVQPALVLSYGMHASPLHKNYVPVKPRNQTLFFAGRICGDRGKPLEGIWPNCDLSLNGNNGYSAGTRQKIHYHHWNRTGFQIVTSSKTYGKDMRKSKFCLAPTGGGHGKRNVLASVMGCVPVTVTDNVYQPFEPELNWKDFSISLPEVDIPRLHEVLSAVSEDQLHQLQARLWCGAQHLFWSSIYGSILGDDGRYDAFEMVMEILRMRIKYPGLEPQNYAEKDEDFKRFMTCVSAPLQEDPDLCTRSEELSSKVFPCKHCNAKVSRLGMPGGAICCDKKKLAKCPRLWP